jgi:hypothetical protein
MATAAADGGLPPATSCIGAREEGLRRADRDSSGLAKMVKEEKAEQRGLHFGSVWEARSKRQRLTLLGCRKLDVGWSRGGGSAGAGISLGPILPQREAAAARRGDRAAA